MKNIVPALSAGLAAASIWGGMYVVSKVVLDVIPPFALLSLRLLLGFLTLSAVAAFRSARHGKGGRIDIRGKAVGVALAVGFVGYGVSLGFQFVGTKLSTASAASLVTSSTPALVLPFAVVLLKEKITPRRLASLVAATIGVIAVVEPWKSGSMIGNGSDATAGILGGAASIGNLCLILAAAAWALYSVLVRKVTATSDIVSASAVMLVGGLPTSLVFGGIEVARIGIGPIHLGIVAGVLFLGFISTALAMFLWNYAFAKLPASTAALTFFAQPVVGTLLGWAALGERITPFFLVGGVLIGIGLVVARKD
jgi:drug/metabolite transporter (DMT)-like permease